MANYYESWYYNGLVRFSMRSKLLLQPKMMMPWQYLHYLIVYNTIIDGNFYYQNYFRYWRERPQTICKEDICMRIGLALSWGTFKKTWCERGFGSLKSNSNRYKGQITKKNWSTKRHCTTQNSTKNRHWKQMLMKDRKFLLHWWHPWCCVVNCNV